MPDPRPGDTIGDFHLLEEIGRGGMGVVFRARQLSLRRDVALKVLAPTADEEAMLRFRREAAALARLHHPHVVEIYLVGEEDGCSFIAMELVEGEPLSATVERRAVLRPGERTSREEVLAIVRQLRDAARGVGAAHRAGLVHRDVKPSNLLVGRDGRVVVVDFGLARDRVAGDLTRTGTVLGTPHYASPEQLRGGEVAPPADVWGLAATLYAALAGRPPFRAESAEALLRAIAEEEPPPLARVDAAVPPEVEAVVRVGLEKDPARRYRDADAFADDLDRVLAGEPPVARPSGPITRALRRARRRRVPLPLLAGALALAFLLAFFVWRQREERLLERTIQAAVAALDEERLDDARSILDAAVREHGEPPLLFLAADLALRERRFADAAELFERLVERTEGAERRAAEAGRLLARSLAEGRAVEEIPAGEPASAREAYYRGLMHQTRREWDEAVRWTRRALDLDPDLVEAWYALGGVLFRLGDLEAAEEAFTRYDRRRSRAEVKNRLGRIDLMKNRYESAAAHFERYCRDRPGDVVGWNNLACAHAMRAIEAENLGLHERAEQARRAAEAAIEKAKALDPGTFLVAFNEAVVRLLDGDLAGAEERFAEALRRFGRDATREPEWGMTMWTHFAGLLVWAGWPERALFYLDEARRGNEAFASDPRWVVARAEALAALGRGEEARALLDAALAGPLAGDPAVAAAREALAEGKNGGG